MLKTASSFNEYCLRYGSEAGLYTPEVQKFSKNLGTTSKFQLPEGQHAAHSTLRELVDTTQICRLEFMHPCCILLTNSAEITHPKQNFEVFDIKSSSGNCVFMGGVGGQGLYTQHSVSK